jgi:hypothetical protein
VTLDVMPPEQIVLSFVSKLARLYGLRAESPRGACAVPPQAAACSLTTLVPLPREPISHVYSRTKNRTAWVAVSVTRQVEEDGAE